jgi:hypothetical protein
VVKDRAAATDPFLTEPRFRLGGGLRVDGNGAGGLRLRTPDGQVVATSGQAQMWDSTPGTGDAGEPAGSTAEGPSTGARRAVAGLAVTGTDLVLSPPRSFLTDPATVYPAYLDPIYYGSAASAWAYANNQNNTNDDTSVARVGLNPSYDYAIYRSLFKFPMSTGGYDLRGARITDATFEATLYHSYSCGPTPVSLWRTSGVPSTPRSNWTAFSMDSYLDTQWAAANKGSCYTSSTPVVRFRGNLAADIGTAAAQRWSNYAVALSAMDADRGHESDSSRWKKFLPDSVRLYVTFNHAPSAPVAADLSTVPATTCTTAAPYARVNPDHDLRLQARLSDPDGGNVKAQWSVTGIASGYAPPDSAYYASGSTIETTVPAGAFTDGQTYSWQVRANDGEDPGPWSPLCGFVVDSTVPAPPSVASTQLNLGDGWIPPPAAPGAEVGTPAEVTLSPAAGDTDVAGYRFSVDTTFVTPTQWVPASAGGATVVPIVPVTSVSPDNYLSVVAVDAAGNASDEVHYRFRANAAGNTHGVRGDLTGDGRSDVVGVYDAGGGQTQLVQWDSRADGAGVYPPVTGPSIAGFPTATTRWLTGDFNGDHVTDAAAWRSEAGGRVTITLFTGNGNGFKAGTPQDAGVSGWGTSMSLVAGDFTGDGNADIAALINYGGIACTSALFVWPARADGQGFAAAPTNTWQSANGSWCQESTRIAIGDFTGDGRADIAGMYDNGGCTTALWLFAGNGTGFDAPVRTWTSQAGAWCWAATRLAATDLDGDGDDDVMAFHDDGNNSWTVWNFAAPGMTGATVAGHNSSGSNAAKLKLFSGDFDGDGRGELGHLYDYGNSQTKIWMLYSTGSSLGQETLRWDSGTGGLDWNRLTVP